MIFGYNHLYSRINAFRKNFNNDEPFDGDVFHPRYIQTGENEI